MSNETAERALKGEYAEALLRTFAAWGNTTTIILHAGCVFEFKGVFPTGEIGQGFYNLHGESAGFEGHIRLDAIASIAFQDKLHRGQESYAFVFENQQGETMFKVFLGRNGEGRLIQSQLEAFKKIRQTGKV